MSAWRGRWARQLMLDWLTVAVLGVLLWPMIWVLLSSFKPDPDIQSGDIWPATLTLDHYAHLFARRDFIVALRNSLVVGLAVAVLTAALAMPAAYSISRFRYRGRGSFAALILGAQMLPAIAILVPVVVIMRRLGLVNTLAGLVIMHLALGLPVAVWMLKGYVDALPRELEEAALTDGCGRFAALRLIVIPLLRPAIFAVATFAFVLSWGEYVMALALVSKAEFKTLPLALQALFDPYSFGWGEIMAGGVVIAAPAAILFLIFRKQLVGGLTAGAVKG